MSISCEALCSEGCPEGLNDMPYLSFDKRNEGARVEERNYRMKQLIPILTELGLTQTESTLYIAGLSAGPVPVSDLAKITGIKRTTVYHALEGLLEKGIAAKHGTPDALVFEMSSPQQVSRLIDQRVSLLENQKRLLGTLSPSVLTAPPATPVKVSHFEGIEGIKLAIEEALYCTSRKWDIIAPSKNFFSEFDERYAQYFLETRKARGIVARSLWERDSSRKNISAEDLSMRQPRYVPPVMYGTFSSVIILFDDKVLLISSLKELSAIYIHSQEMHTTMKALFEGLWSVSEE